MNMSAKLPDFLEEIGSFTPSEDTTTHTFGYDGQPGVYLIIRSPRLTEEQLTDGRTLPGSGAAYCAFFFLSGETLTFSGGRLYTLRPSLASQNWIDNWGMTGCSITTTEINIDLASGSRNKFEAGYTYKLFRIKMFAD